MITRRFKDAYGNVYERWFETYKDVPDYIFVPGTEYDDGTVGSAKALRVFETPAFQFVGSFSGGTTPGQVKTETDDGSYIEPGRFKDIDNQKKHLEDKRDKERHDLLEKEFSSFDESVLRDPQIW